MRLGVIIAAVVGLALATAIAAWLGFGAVFAALERVGWRGLATLCLYSALPFSLLGAAWFVLGRHEAPRRWPVFIWARVVRDSAGELLPFSHLGGFFVGARAAIERGVAPITAFSTTVVDVTTELIAQLGFIGLGVGLLVMRLGLHSSHNALLGAAALGLLLTGLGAAAFVALQRRSGLAVERLTTRFLPGATARAGRVIEAVDALYHSPGRIGAAVLLHLAAWLASACGVWVALRLAGIRIDISAILAIESLVGAMRSAVFFVPMGVGVQEASYVVLGGLFGLSPELFLAVSLLKRARDLAIGVPALLAWQGLEGVRLVGQEAGEASENAG
jgi:putative membrane protein